MKFLYTILATIASMASLTDAYHTHGHQHYHQHLNRQTNSTTTNRMVFAHLIVGIVSNRNSSTDWDADMIRAKAYGIDAFALNIGTDPFTDTQLQYAYTSAANNGMKLFISFDFNFWSTGSANAVGQKIAQYGSLPAQLKVDGKIFVSSFVGDGVDVQGIRNAAGSPIYFAPNFHPSYGTSMASVDAALNWMGWPNNGQNRAPDSTSISVEQGDADYIKALGSKDYLAPVSPWFFTHFGAEVSYSKNWLFPGEMLWYQRWNRILASPPRFVEIISWNDYGESHYVGPLSSIHTDDGASKWVNDMPHNGWLDMAKPYIAAYKAGASSVTNYITSDQVIYWYRPQLMNTNCDATDTCMQDLPNYDGQYYKGRPNGWQTVTDSVFAVTLLKSAATLQIKSGNTTKSFSAPAGASSFSTAMGVGKQAFTLLRGFSIVMSGTSLKDIIDGCVCGLYNFNAYVGSLPAGSSDALNSDGLAVFTKGLKVSTCSATPSLGSTSSTSTSSKTSSATTTSTSVTTSISSTTTSAVSSTTTSKSTTPSTTASTTPSSTTTLSTTPSTTPSTTSPSSTTPSSTTKSSTTTPSTTPTTTPTTTLSTTTRTTTTSSTTTTSAVCNAGQGSNNYAGLCSFCCNYGYCPPGPCTCTSYGAPNTPPPSQGVHGVPADGLDASYSGLCSFACDHGYCPSGACKVA